MDQATEVALAAIRAVEERDADALFGLYHDDIVFLEPDSLPYGGEKSGREALRQELEERPETTWLGAWGPLQPTDELRRMHPEVLASDGREVALRYRVRAEGPDGESFEDEVLGVYEIRDGLLARAQMFHYDAVACIDFLARASAQVA